MMDTHDLISSIATRLSAVADSLKTQLAVLEHPADRTREDLAAAYRQIENRCVEYQLVDFKVDELHRIVTKIIDDGD